MFPPLNQTKATQDKQVSALKGVSAIQYLSFLSCLVLSINNIPPAAAHKIEIAGDVGGTLHIEPNDTPRAGEAAQAWFALTRKGGKSIPLTQCDCQLAVYAEPHIPGEPALIEPSLTPVNAERYQGIPGADITFPKPGIYQLQLTGKPKAGANFQPFDLKFEVTVAAGAAGIGKPLQSQENVVVVESEASSLRMGGIPIWAIALSTVAVLGIILFVWQRQKGKS
ncbi:hypothetical protein [Anabaena sp. 4-3]|uniref:hypothetical protein n=1 Tax=Anabaena sp. 4-3 TaxID=1811979 RepID=UPI0008317A29|nr:hypothetical protein [Anabaena sp. 4-3]